MIFYFWIGNYVALITFKFTCNIAFEVSIFLYFFNSYMWFLIIFSNLSWIVNIYWLLILAHILRELFIKYIFYFKAMIAFKKVVLYINTKYFFLILLSTAVQFVLVSYLILILIFYRILLIQFHKNNYLICLPAY